MVLVTLPPRKLTVHKLKIHMCGTCVDGGALALLHGVDPIMLQKRRLVRPQERVPRFFRDTLQKQLCHRRGQFRALVSHAFWSSHSTTSLSSLDGRHVSGVVGRRVRSCHAETITISLDGHPLQKSLHGRLVLGVVRHTVMSSHTKPSTMSLDGRPTQANTAVSLTSAEEWIVDRFEGKNKT